MKTRMMRAGSTVDAGGDPSAGWFVHPNRLTPVVCAWGLAALAPWARAQPCEPAWSARFASEGLDRPVMAIAVVGKGPSASLLVGGHFGMAGRVLAAGVARWNGAGWSALGSPSVVGVLAVAQVREAMGDAVYVGGDAGTWGHPGDYLARWDGSAWTVNRDFRVLSCVDCAPGVRALHVRDEGGKQVLYAGGVFDRVSGVPGGSVARWDGRLWDALDGGVWHGPPFPVRLFGFVESIVEHDDGRGPALFVGGYFNRAGDGAGAVATPSVARWDGTAWSAVGRDQIETASVECLVSWEEGGRPQLVAGGRFDALGGIQARNVARWDGTAWSAMGLGLGDRVEALAVFDDGAGPALYAGGRFTLPTGERGLARWNGSEWRAVGGGLGGGNRTSVNALAVWEDESRPSLFLGGEFLSAGGVPSTFFAAWRGCRACYPDCDTTTGPGVLDIFDFLCFQSRFDVAAPYACDCDTSTGRGVCDIFDFLCFQNEYDAGCP